MYGWVSDILYKKIIWPIFTLSILFLTSTTQAVEIDFTCLRYEDVSKIALLREHMDERSMLHYVNDKTTICVSQKDKEDFHSLAEGLFPPKYDTMKKIKVPNSPSGTPLESIKLFDQKLKKELKAALTKQNIWFTEDEKESIWYEISNRRKVEAISFKLFENKK